MNFQIIKNKYPLFLIIAVIFLISNSCSKNKYLIENNRSRYSIYVSDKAAQPEKFAARELQKCLNKMTGVRLPIVNAYDQKIKLVYIGFKDVPQKMLAGLNKDEFGKEEFIIRTVDGNMLIAGGEPRGTLYGVLGFLNDLGCRWYTRNFTKIPQRSSIALPEKEIRQKPAFEYREAWYNEAYDPIWAVHNRLNPSIHPIPDSLGGSYITYPFVHSFNYLVPPEKYFKTHPEYYSLINGKREAKPYDTQLCLTNPDVVKIAIETVFKWIKEHPDANVFSIDQNDGYGYCECENCKKLDEAEGSHAGTLLNFVNQIADTVAKVYPDVKLQTLAYAYTEIPPKHIKPADNVTIRLCHYDYCSAHSILGCDNHKPFIKRLQQWKKIAKRITIWDYFGDYHYYLTPFPNFNGVVNNVRYYADNGCIGLFAQGSMLAQNGGGEFAALRAWVFAQLMWNPQQDGWKLIDEFVDNVYGPSAPYISQYIKMLHEKVKPKTVYFSIYSPPTDGGYLTVETLKKAEELFNQAEKAASGDETLLKRVELTHLPVLYSRLYFYSIGGRADLSKEEMPAVLAKFEKIIKDNKITRMAETEGYREVDAFIKRVKEAYEFISDWQIIGPFANDNRKGLKTAYPPEKEFETAKTYKGVNGTEVKWKTYSNPLSGYVDFTKLFSEHEQGVAYAHTTLEAERSGKVKIGVGQQRRRKTLDKR